MGAQLVMLGVPYCSAHAINALQLQGLAGLQSAGQWLALVLFLTMVSWALHGPGRIFERNIAWVVRSRLATGLLDRVLTLPLAWHESNHSAATSHRIQQSTHALSDFAQSQYIYMSSAVRLVGPVIALSVLDLRVGLMSIAGFVFISYAVSGFDRAMIRFAHEENNAERRYASAMIDALGNTSSLFALRQSRAVIALIKRRLLEVFEPIKRSLLMNEAKWCTVDVGSRALSCLLVALFAWLKARQSIASGTQQTLLLGSLYMVWEYAQQAGGVISAIAAHFQTFARQQADYASADIIRNAPSTDVNAIIATPQTLSWRRLDIQSLTFRHAASRETAPTLNQVNCVLERGKRYALVGGSGSGKSTLLRILAGLYVAEHIVISSDTEPSTSDPQQASRYLRGGSTLIPQDAEVFEGTLAENLNLSSTVNGAAPLEANFAMALSTARATDFIEPTPAGLNMHIAERAANWSGGQRARVALARGVLAGEASALLLLDEPTASLDPRTEAAVLENIFREFGDACIVASIHRLNLLDRFDEVLVMQAGKLVAQGTPAATALHSPELAQLMSAQNRETSPGN
jgi:ATP-binding cassette subfamily B protein